ncbi:DUF1704 domain-containing protein [Candidatus Peribacteria bacterium]|jgi:alpha-L-glutamate ligase-like protein/uncharacterized protein (TIGR02421 family)|nr:DUF1704 domain-containing protein [Candidatus Peribacteria bacterium]MBT4021659.1 DUF1704 domain-containing protein [Candidatus Peribacteria bacterium]MBT4240823.1 DUF1704 domain-containing protein [Candidatus Peribacteria bacterium]MBT4474148.1 DUF1704 domain-containing protein [Candidatus Peribacteria bacterium]
MFFFLPKNHGILGINARNLKYLKPFNPRKAVAFADDKLKTKAFLEARGVPVPRLYAKLSSREDIRSFDFSSLPDSCVLKPNFGYGGEGIIVLSKKEHGGWKTAGGKHISYEEIFRHCEDILDGMYSLNHRKDVAFFEQTIISHSCFDSVKPAGLPDLRIIVHNLVPVMAMMRLPTAESEGKANLHIGGIGLGIDIAKGSTTFAVQGTKRIDTLPDGKAILNFKIPYWEEMLLISSRIQQITNIGFLGVDMTIDKDSGPILLEVNARAGLRVQLANLAPLGKRLDRVEGLSVSSPEKGVRIAQDLFGEKVSAKEPEAKEEKPVLGTREDIEIIGGKKSMVVPAILRPDHDRTVFDPSLIDELDQLGAIERTSDGNIKVKFVLGGKKLQTVVFPLPIEEEGVHASLGKRDLKNFLVDPGKNVESEGIKTTVDLKRLDKQLADIDRKVQLLKYIRPENLEEERVKAEEDKDYNPVFKYSELDFDSNELMDRLSYLESDDSAFGIILDKKKEEIINKIKLLKVRGDNSAFQTASIALYGSPIQSLVKEARGILQSRKKDKKDANKKEMLSAEKVKDIFSDILTSYGLNEWSAEIKSTSVSDCAVGGKKVMIRAGSEFSKERVDSLIAHEIETHVLCAVNGEKQAYQIFRRGMADYLDTQEGLAIYNQNAVLPENHEKRFWPAMNILAINYGSKHSFAELRSYIRRLGFDDVLALRTCFKVKRGMGDTVVPGVFTRNLIYFRGLKDVTEYLENGGDMKDLYIGRINLKDLDLIEKTQGIIDPIYLPKTKRDT